MALNQPKSCLISALYILWGWCQPRSFDTIRPSISPFQSLINYLRTEVGPWYVEQYPSLYFNWKIWKRALWALTDYVVTRIQIQACIAGHRAPLTNDHILPLGDWFFHQSVLSFLRCLLYVLFVSLRVILHLFSLFSFVPQGWSSIFRGSSPFRLLPRSWNHPPPRIGGWRICLAVQQKDDWNSNVVHLSDQICHFECHFFRYFSMDLRLLCRSPRS